MNEKIIDQIEEEVLICEISDEAVEAAGTRTEIAGVWTFVCTGIQCGQVFHATTFEARSCANPRREATELGGDLLWRSFGDVECPNAGRPRRQRRCRYIVCGVNEFEPDRRLALALKFLII